MPLCVVCTLECIKRRALLQMAPLGMLSTTVHVLQWLGAVTEKHML